MKTSENVRLGITSLPNNAKTTLTSTENIVRLSIFLKGRTNNFLSGKNNTDQYGKYCEVIYIFKRKN